MDETDGKTILIVDDEPDIREVLAISLQDMGYRTVEAENARQAFELFVSESPPVVVTDIKMPEGDGIGLLRKIKHENPDTEVIMITGHGDMDLAIRSLKYEATDFITKPINVDALEIALRRAREKIAMRRQLQDYTRSLEQLVREKTELQNHLASLGLMIGSISHGMKGLLTSLDGGLYLVSSGLNKKDLNRVEEGCAAAKETAARIRKMVLDILYYAKERELQRAPVKAPAFVEGLARVIQPMLDGFGIRLACHFDRSAGRMHVDADYLHAALVNILENAVDACTKDHRTPTNQIDFSMADQGDEIIITIADNGIGMDSDTRSQIFDLFYSTKGKKGTGLGLFIANRIIGQHGGTITVASNPGDGTVFRVKIPKKPPTDS
ncbi:sensor histidine kinase [Desulfosarcina sp.]|uniref:sensor histidine kinase n=1 Tax=Desulfosarcina sp. TaxID=2027861 RepID=UPI003970986B